MKKSNVKQRCKHIWETVFSWGVNTYWMRRICFICKERQIAKIELNFWKIETRTPELSVIDYPLTKKSHGE